MSRLARHTAAALAVCVTAYGCAESSGTSASDPTSPDPAFSFSNGPETPGPIVFRGVDEFGVFFIPDDRAGLTAYIGVAEPVSVFCNFALPITITPMELQALIKPTGELGWHTKGDELPIYIYDLSTVDFCGGELTDDRILATGTVRLKFVDREFELPDPNVEPSYGYNATGIVTYVGGGTAHVSGTVRWKTTGAQGWRATSHLQLTRDR
jgi:hypothetical protein